MDEDASHFLDFLNNVFHDIWPSPDLLTFLTFQESPYEPENNIIVHLRVIDRVYTFVGIDVHLNKLVEYILGKFMFPSGYEQGLGPP